MSDDGSDGRGAAARYWSAIWALLFSGMWFYVAVAAFLLIVWSRGWDATFRSGDAYLYLLGVAISVIGEIGIELAQGGAKDLLGSGSRVLRGPERAGFDPILVAGEGLGCDSTATCSRCLSRPGIAVS